MTIEAPMSNTSCMQAFSSNVPVQTHDKAEAFSEAFPKETDVWKRAFDIAIALSVLAFALPLLVLLIVLISMDGNSPFFGHQRVGRFGRKFRCWKLRTMVPDAQQRIADLLANDEAAREEWARDHKLRKDPRITRIGRFLRASSLDELPQMVNVIVGEMSLVGPRPIVEAEITRYGPRFRHYTAVTPGVTGLWQISGRNNTTYRRRVAIDTVYSKQRSLRMDFWILINTIPAVLISKGAS
jgi:exopolysaccharide production protein ExoY